MFGTIPQCHKETKEDKNIDNECIKVDILSYKGQGPKTL